MDGKVNKKFYTKNGCFAWACEKDICWMLGFFLSLSKVWGKKFSEKKKLKSLRLIQETHKNHTKWFFRSRTCIWCCYLSAPTVHVSAFFLLFFFNYLSAYFISLLRICSFFHFNFVFQLLWVLRWNSVEKNLFTHASKHTSTHIQKKTLPFFLSFHSIETLSGQRFCPELIIYTWHCNNRSISMND